MKSARVFIFVWVIAMLMLVIAFSVFLVRPGIDFHIKLLALLAYVAVALGSLWAASRVLARHVHQTKENMRAGERGRIIEISPTDPRKAILERIGDINDPRRPRPLVSLELFFEGNNDPGSIGYNLPDPPEPSVFYELLKKLRDRDDVKDILIEVKDLQDPDGWPASDSIWFITTATPEEVRDWFPPDVAPDEVFEVLEKTRAEAYELPEGFRAVLAWYD